MIRVSKKRIPRLIKDEKKAPRIMGGNGWDLNTGYEHVYSYAL
jgi:hypothetical protein